MEWLSVVAIGVLTLVWLGFGWLVGLDDVGRRWSSILVGLVVAAAGSLVATATRRTRRSRSGPSDDDVTELLEPGPVHVGQRVVMVGYGCGPDVFGRSGIVVGFDTEPVQSSPSTERDASSLIATDAQ